jgi:predicted RNA-binding Zn-ribbon protein involved in translation (DUF1610 family)
MKKCPICGYEGEEDNCPTCGEPLEPICENCREAKSNCLCDNPKEETPEEELENS